MLSKLDKCYNINDLCALAKRRLPSPIFHYIDGGADDEVTMRENSSGFGQYRLVPETLRDVSDISLSTKVLGMSQSWPIILSPTGMNRLFHHDAESAVIRAAKNFGTTYSLSTLATTSLEDVAKLTDGPKVFQVYIFKDRGLTQEFVQRCKAANYHALCLTVDMPIAGNRERDKRWGMSMPPAFGVQSLASFAAHPEWSLRSIFRSEFDLANVSHRIDRLAEGSTSLIDYVNEQFDRTVTWDDAKWLRKEWGGPFIIKGITSSADACHAVDIGASAIMVSNHGGRQLDNSLSCIDALPAIVDAVGGKIDIILDGGIRRGTHVIKALALGATACSIGKAYLYGLAAGGQRGVERALTLLHDEIERDMRLMGCAKISDIEPRHVRRIDDVS